jgi:hypothetical protein
MASAAQIDAILSRFPGPVMLYRSRKKWWLVLFASLVLAYGGYGMIGEGKLMGWFVLAFFGLVAVTAAASLLPGAGKLTLDASGFEVVNLFRRFRSRWQDVGNFQPIVLPRTSQKFVGYDTGDFAGRPVAGAVARFNVRISGRAGMLPDTYGLSADDLATLMTRWRERAVGRQ